MPKILVIEDESRVADLLKRGLEESEHSVRVADSVINYLRKKINKNFDTKLIHTKPGMGFIFS